MTTHEIATRLVELCREGKYDQVYEELYSPEVTSCEPTGEIAHGIEGIKEKGKAWNENIAEMHSGFVDDPIIAPHSFACVMGFDATMKDGVRMEMKEIAVYTVKDGKVVKEEFYN